MHYANVFLNFLANINLADCEIQRLEDLSRVDR